MASINTKYSVGDKVYLADTHGKVEKAPCPDCLGAKKWDLVSPAGVEYKIDCPRCSGQYQSEKAHSLDFTNYVPYVTKLTIGSVRVDTNDDNSITYMCVETGVGGGRVYNENQLFETEEEALVEATAKAAGRNLEPKAFTTMRRDWVFKLCDFQLHLIPKALRDEDPGSTKGKKRVSRKK